jgi:hypothetical protein
MIAGRKARQLALERAREILERLEHMLLVLVAMLFEPERILLPSGREQKRESLRGKTRNSL